MEPLIRLRNVSKVYEGTGVGWRLPHSTRAQRLLSRGLKAIWGERKERVGVPRVKALHDVNLEIFRGEFSAIAGPSGSGKSTLLNVIGTLDAPTSGEVFFEGRRLSGLSENQLSDFRLRSLGFVFQAYNLIPVLSALENVEYALTLQNVPRPERRARAMEALRWVGLESAAHRRPDLLSGGQQQRVAVARAIVHRPTLVLADEPTANLDSKTAKHLLELMLELNKKHGVTFLFSSHDLQVLTLARRVVQIRDGVLQNREK